jgi:CDP-6-deoxy-D-xylo-4-hexulose-3-dehydrase
VRQPAYRDVPHRVVGELVTSDLVMERAFWVGCYPGLSEDALAHTAERMHAAFGRT